MKLTIETRSKTKFRALIGFLRSNGYKVHVHDEKMLFDDLGIPGNKVSEEQLEKLAMVMEKESDGEYAKTVFDRLISKYSK